MKTILLAATALSAFVMSAHAADLPSRTARPAAAVSITSFDWTGFYLGANAGYGFGNGKASNVNFNDNAHPGATFDMNGGLVGGQAGYNYQIGQIVLGVEADLAYANIKGSYDFEAPVVTVSGKVEFVGTVRARVGFAIDKALIFATGGFAYGSVKSDLAGYGDTSASTLSQTGYTLGGGVEYALNNHWSVKAEYLYVKFSKKNVLYNLSSIPVSADGGVTTNAVRVGVNYKF